MDQLISTSVEGSALVIAGRGEIDLYTAPQLKEALAEGLDAGYTVIVVDLSDVSYLDSTALGILLAAHRALESEGSGLRLVVKHPYLQKVFHITGFDELLRIHENRAEALATE